MIQSIYKAKIFIKSILIHVTVWAFLLALFTIACAEIWEILK